MRLNPLAYPPELISAVQCYVDQLRGLREQEQRMAAPVEELDAQLSGRLSSSSVDWSTVSPVSHFSSPALLGTDCELQAYALPCQGLWSWLMTSLDGLLMSPCVSLCLHTFCAFVTLLLQPKAAPSHPIRAHMLRSCCACGCRGTP